tara:strand:- start:50 stop:289 length:240 start_codon:yes stop_codon:yes gene_type:complete
MYFLQISRNTLQIDQKDIRQSHDNHTTDLYDTEVKVNIKLSPFIDFKGIPEDDKHIGQHQNNHGYENKLIAQIKPILHK